MKTVRTTPKTLMMIVMSCLFVLGSGFLSTAGAELKPMSDKEMKSTRLNDFVRPLNRAIVVGQPELETKDIEKELREVQAPVLATTEVFDPEAFFNDMKIQLEQINKGEPPIAGLFPFIQNEADKQHLLKQ